MFSPPLLRLRLSFCILRCRHVSHTFSLTSGVSSVGTKMNSDPRHERDSDIMYPGCPPCQRIMCVDTPEGGLTTDLCSKNKGFPPPSHHPLCQPGLQNKTETNKSNFRLDLSCLGLSTHTKSPSSGIWIQHYVSGSNHKNSLTL